MPDQFKLIDDEDVSTVAGGRSAVQRPTPRVTAKATTNLKPAVASSRSARPHKGATFDLAPEISSGMHSPLRTRNNRGRLIEFDANPDDARGGPGSNGYVFYHWLPADGAPYPPRPEKLKDIPKRSRFDEFCFLVSAEKLSAVDVARLAEGDGRSLLLLTERVTVLEDTSEFDAATASRTPRLFRFGPGGDVRSRLVLRVGSARKDPANPLLCAVRSMLFRYDQFGIATRARLEGPDAVVIEPCLKEPNERRLKVALANERKAELARCDDPARLDPYNEPPPRLTTIVGRPSRSGPEPAGHPSEYNQALLWDIFDDVYLTRVERRWGGLDKHDFVLPRGLPPGRHVFIPTEPRHVTAWTRFVERRMHCLRSVHDANGTTTAHNPYDTCSRVKARMARDELDAAEAEREIAKADA